MVWHKIYLGFLFLLRSFRERFPEPQMSEEDTRSERNIGHY